MKLAAPGIDWATGRPLVAPDTADVAAAVRAAPDLGTGGFQRFALPGGMPPGVLSKSGWAVVFPEGAGSQLREALSPLLVQRRQEAGRYYRELQWTKADVNARAWLKRHHAGTTVDPGAVPYYLLLAAPPTAVTFEAQFELSNQGYAVGRLDLGDEPAAWRSYADGVCAAEAKPPWRPRRMGVWATRQDEATRASHDAFAVPLAAGVPGATEEWQRAAADVCGFGLEQRMQANATRRSLIDLLEKGPALLLTASHGIGVATGTGDPLALQGALLAQDWLGLGPPRREDLVAADDLGDDLDVHGLVALVMACFGAGTSARDSFPWPPAQRKDTSRYYGGRPFVAALPRRLLTHPRGPALAILGHVDRAFSWSFAPEEPGERNGAFRTFLLRLMQGERVGHAAAEIWIRCNALAAQLAAMLGPGAPPATDDEIAIAWIQFRDMRNYVLLGDPAARLCAKLS